MLYMVTLTINIPQMLASIYHTYGSVMGYGFAKLFRAPLGATERPKACGSSAAQQCKSQAMDHSKIKCVFHSRAILDG